MRILNPTRIAAAALILGVIVMSCGGGGESTGTGGGIPADSCNDNAGCGAPTACCELRFLDPDGFKPFGKCVDKPVVGDACTEDSDCCDERGSFGEACVAIQGVRRCAAICNSDDDCAAPGCCALPDGLAYVCMTGSICSTTTCTTDTDCFHLAGRCCKGGVCVDETKVSCQ